MKQNSKIFLSIVDKLVVQLFIFFSIDDVRGKSGKIIKIVGEVSLFLQMTVGTLRGWIDAFGSILEGKIQNFSNHDGWFVWLLKSGKIIEILGEVLGFY